MSKVTEVINKYSDLYGLISEQDPAAAPPPDPAAGAVPPAPAAPPPAPEPPSHQQDVQKIQAIQDALGIDPKNIMTVDKGVFADTVTPENAKATYKKLLQIIQDNQNPRPR